ncbi:MAG: hypothetical protein KGV44_09635 [Flavobacteriaceae bacterium]|nr:hypothetical protein [Flavobacteriaceae bacterium]
MRLKPQQYWAIIITLLFHTVLFWGLFFSEMNKTDKQDAYEIELKEEDTPTEQNKAEEIKKIAEQELKEMLSNKASKRMLKGEKIAQAKITNDTELLEQEFEERKQKTNAIKTAQKTPEITVAKKEEVVEPKIDTLQQQTVFYVGNSRVEYFLAERFRVKLPIPAYQCEGAGTVEVVIWVNRQGAVTNAEVVKFRSQSATDCMRENALKAALSSLFSKRPNAPLSQKGRIVYLFAKQ